VIRRIPQAETAGRVDALSAPRAAYEARVPTAAEQARQQHAAMARALTLLLSEELAARPEHIAHVLERELVRVRRAREVVVRLHPEDLALLRAPDHAHAELLLDDRLSLVADDAVSRGGCLLSSPLGDVDAQLETRLGLALTLLQSGALT
jgi:flagellar assembly protein FliH